MAFLNSKDMAMIGKTEMVSGLTFAGLVGLNAKQIYRSVLLTVTNLSLRSIMGLP